MPAQAKVSSIAALDTFRSSLIVYLERARHILDDQQSEILHTRTWLEHDRQSHWKKQIRLRGHELAQAEQELLTARLSDQNEAVRDRRRVVDRARARLTEAEQALQRTQRWLRQYDHQLDPHLRTTNPLRRLLDHDLVKAIALLSQTTETLADYAALAPNRNPTPTADADPATEPAAPNAPETASGPAEGGAP
ncbi:MAG: hypothetical protein KJ072_15380 [Verrucomicrobia bacterium]|nr:hypothetical protein [Verrucomicrobiota bacterium]